jgi:hypothetical protein
VIALKLVDDEKGLKLRHVILNGDGNFPEKMILEIICEKYNGNENIILYPRKEIKRQSGVGALGAIKTLGVRRYNNFIFIVDGEHIEEDPKSEIKRKLSSIGIACGDEIIPLQDAFLIQCRTGPHEFYLYCIIWGPDVCIEEEVARFIELKLNIRVNIPEGSKDARWRKELKQEIDSIIGRRELKRQLKEANIMMLENSFPSICAVLKFVERNFHFSHNN